MYEVPHETHDEEPNSFITDEDLTWLENYGIDLHSNPDSRIALEHLANLGSRDLETITDEATIVEVVEAREQFFKILGVNKEAVAIFRSQHPTLIPIDTFVTLQRYMSSIGLNAARLMNINPAGFMLDPASIQSKLDALKNLGLDPIKAVNALPAALSIDAHLAKLTYDDFNVGTNKKVQTRTPVRVISDEKIGIKVDGLESLGLNGHKILKKTPAVLTLSIQGIKARLDRLSDLGLDAVNIVNDYPSILTFSIDSVRDKITHIQSLGLDPIRIISMNANVLGHAIDTIRDKFDDLNSLGLDAVKVINSLPQSLNYAVESIKEKLDNLTEMGLNATAIINTAPSILSKSPDTIRARLQLLRHICHTLKWEHSAEELVENIPAILSYDNNKLLVLARIAATNLSVSDRGIAVEKVKPMLITPLENYVIALEQNNRIHSASELLNAARRVRLPQKARRERALIVAPALGEVGASYLRYRNTR